MKRTPLNRGTSELKRTPFKPRTTELPRTGRIQPKSRRHGDTDESLKVREDYRRENPKCEVTAWLQNELKRASRSHRDQMRNWIATAAMSCDYRPVQLDHLWEGRRIDVKSMLIVVEAVWHEWKTANTTVGRLLFIIVKAHKNPPEIDNDEFCRCSGRASLKGWLEMDATVAACPSWLEAYRLELLASL